MRWKHLLLLVMIAILSPSLSWAQKINDKEREYNQFIQRYLCLITSYLTGLSKSELNRNQFIILNPKENPSNYVQCLFRPAEPVWCEAASYYFRNPPEGPELYRMPDEKRRILESYRFTFQPRGNFFLEVVRPVDGDYEPLARFLLTVLFEAYDVRLKNMMRIDVPPTLEADPSCKTLPVS